MIAAASIGKVLKALWPRGDTPTTPQVYAVLDGARDRRIEPLLRLSGAEYECLYAGKLSPRFAAAAPYLAHLALDDRLTRDLVQTGWGAAWGVFLVVPAEMSFKQLRRHLRGLLKVRDEAGRILVFRYYDPRVLSAYLPTCTSDEARQVFGPIDRIVMESDDAGAMLTGRPAPDGVRIEPDPL